MKGSTPNAKELEPVFASVVIELLKEEGKLDFFCYTEYVYIR
jgi:hypothetical protein